MDQQNPSDRPYEQIMRSAHLLKGASANLMCGQLRSTAMELEQAARTAHEAGGMSAPAPIQQKVQEAMNQLQVAVQQLKVYLQSLGL